jgi:hypothetical protein
VEVAAKAWHRRLLCGRVEEPALASFIETYRNKGPERIPHSHDPREASGKSEAGIEKQRRDSTDENQEPR